MRTLNIWYQVRRQPPHACFSNWYSTVQYRTVLQQWGDACTVRNSNGVTHAQFATHSLGVAEACSAVSHFCCYDGQDELNAQ